MKPLKFATITALVLSLALFTLPVSTQSVVDDVGVGVDLNGVTFIRVWVAPGVDPLDPTNWQNDHLAAGDLWFEQYTTASGDTWQSWIGVTSFTDAETYVGTGDYYMSSSLSNSAGFLATFYEYEINDVFETQTALSNSLTGYLELEKEHQDPLTFEGARFEEIEKYNEPGGSFVDNLTQWIDLDGDGTYDTAFESWNEFEAGTGDKSVGFSSIDWNGNSFNYQNRSENVFTGDYTFRSKAALDANDDAVKPVSTFDIRDNYNNGGGNSPSSGSSVNYFRGSYPSNFTDSGDDYFKLFWEEFDADDTDFDREEYTWDYPGIFTGGISSFSADDQQSNSLSGEFDNRTDVRLDTDFDNDLNDVAWEGADPGAYREWTQSEFEIGSGQSTRTESRKWDALNNQYTRNWNRSWLSGFAESETEFRWDFNQDGFDSNEDYELTTSSSVNDNGENSQEISLRDFVSDDLGTGVANTLTFDRRETIATGDFEESRDERIDNDNDGDLDDYEEKGAYRMYTSSSFDFNDGYSYSTSETWDPGGDFDPVSGTFGTVTRLSSWSYTGGNSGSQNEFAKDTDNDGEIEDDSQGDDLYISSSTYFDADDLRTTSSTRLTEDWDNDRGAFQELETSSSSIASTGDFRNRSEVVNLAGRVYNENRFDATDGESTTFSEQQFWGDRRIASFTRTYLGGDSLVLSELDLDTDNNTDQDNRDDYEVFVDQFNRVEGDWNYVGYEIIDDDNDTEIAQVQGFSASYDFLAIDEDLGAGGTREQVYVYTSGDLAGGMRAQFGRVELTGPLAASTTGLNVDFARYLWYPGASANPLDWFYLVEYGGPGIT